METLSHSDSYHSRHHELKAGWLMKVSGPKEHLSLTTAISVFNSSPVSELKQGLQVNQKDCFLLCKCQNVV